MIKGPILALLLTGFFIVSRPAAVQKRAPRDSSEHECSCSNSRNAAEGTRGQLDRLNLTHAQREQVEQIMACGALQLQMARGNPNLSVPEYLFSNRRFGFRSKADRVDAEPQTEAEGHRADDSQSCET